MNYTIIQVNLKKYDSAFPCKSKSKNFLFSDVIKQADEWQIIPTQTSDYIWNDVFKIRWNPFKFCETEFVVWVDGSIEVKTDLDELIQQMKDTSSDFAILKHPFRDNIFDEYKEWDKIRNYDRHTAFQWLSYMMSQGFDVRMKNSLYQSTIMIFKNNEMVRNFCSTVWSTLHHFNNEKVERLDQTVASFLIKTQFKNMKVLELPPTLMNSKFFGLHWKHPMQ